MANKPASWVVSVISHGHGAGVAPILIDLHQQLAGRPHELILTLNIPETVDVTEILPDAVNAQLRIIRNTASKGFGSNHNAAIRTAKFDYILLADPELRLPVPIFDALDAQLQQPNIGIVSPRAKTPEGTIEDNGRPLFTPARLIRRYFWGGRGRDTQRTLRASSPEVDWIAGLFLAMRRDVFTKLKGFDTAYFMYCEDIDLSLRARQSGLICKILEDVHIVHPPGRRTFKSRQHFIWHCRSLWRLWHSAAYAWAKQR